MSPNLTRGPSGRLLTAVNAKFRAQSAASGPQVADLQWVLARVDRQADNYPRAIARGDFVSLEIALGAAKQRWATLRLELAQLYGEQL